MKSITFITGNKNKAEWTKRYATIPFKFVAIDLTEIQEVSVEKVVEHKAKEAYRTIKKPVMVEDTNLVFSAWGKLPGTLIKWFLKEIGLEKLCTMLSTDRTAVALVVYGYYDGSKLQIIEQQLQGTISDKPKGTNGFGWDPIFIPDGQNKTYGEMSDEEIDYYSVRRMGLEKLQRELKIL